MVNRRTDDQENDHRRRIAVGGDAGPQESYASSGPVSREQLDRLLDRTEEPRTEWRLRRRVELGFAVAILLTTLLGFLSWYSAQQSAEDADWVAHTHEVSTNLELTLRHLIDVETGERGFVLTGLASFLEPYESGKYAVVQNLQALRLLTRDNRDQQRRLDVLSRQASARIEAGEELVALRRDTGVITNTQLQGAKSLMDAARATVQEMEGEENLRLKQRTQRAHIARQFTVSAIALSSILGLIFLFFAGITVSREISTSARVRSEVKRAEEDITKRKLAEEELRESEARFHAMLNGIPQLAWMAEADGHIFWYNKRWYEYTGTSSEQMEGWGWQSVHDPEFLPKVMERWKGSIADGTDFEMEFPLRAADGCFGMFLTRIVPLRDANGRVLRWFGTSTDISERTRAAQRLAELARELLGRAEELTRSREALEAQTAIFKLVLDSMGEGLIAADREGHFLIFNNAARNLMGRGPEDLPTEQWTPHYKVFLPDGITPYPPDRLPLVLALQGESVRVELIVQPPENLPGKSLEVTARPLRDARGNLCGGVAVLHDVTERKRSEGELARQAEELFRSRQELETQTLMLQSVLDSMVEGLVAADEQGKFIIWNPAAEKIVGLCGSNVPPDEWSAHYGTYLPDTITLFPTDQNPLLRAIRGEASTAEMFIRNPQLDHGIWIESNGAPLRDKNGVVHGGVVAFRDVTQRKADELIIHKLNEDLEERIVVRTGQLEAANRELEAFSYSISHDLRAPLRHIGGFSRILSRDFGSAMVPEARGHLERIENGVRNMTLMVDGLLSLARLGQQSLTLSLSELNALVDGAISILQPERDGRDVEWRIAQLPAIECDPILMGQVFQNLLGNALKYSSRRHKTVIEIDSILQAGKPAVIFVRDNGAGFSMRCADKLFGVFQRLHTEDEFEGTGVGLATVHRIIQKHGGRIWAESEPDHGATFYFTVGEKETIKTTQKAAANQTLERVLE